jgi:hypothetical protein
MLTLDKKLTHQEILAWWESKTPEQKFQTVGVEIIDKWVRGIIEEEFLEVPAPVSAISVIKLLSK